MSDDREFEKLLGQAVDGELADAESRRLAELLKADATRREQYVEAMTLDILLADELGADSVVGAVDMIGYDSTPAKPTKSRTLHRWYLALAASIVIGLVANALLIINQNTTVADNDRLVND